MGVGFLSRLASFLTRRSRNAVTLPPPLVPTSEEVARWWTTARDEQRDGIREQQVHAQTRWDPAMRDRVLQAAETGQFYQLAQFTDALRSDGLINGIMGTMTHGLLRMPVKFSGDPYLVEQLRGFDALYDPSGYCLREGWAGDFWRMVPETELCALVWDGIMAGFGLGELVPQPDGGPPILRALDLHWARYDFERDLWFYQSKRSEYVVRPGDGRWVMFCPYGSRRAWIRGAWWSVALPFIAKQNAQFDRLRWQGQLADPLKVIEAADGAEEKHRLGLIDFVRNLWRRSPGIVSPPKYKPSLVESNGRGYEVYREAEERADVDIQVGLAGQVVTTTGTTGFSSGSVWDNIRLDKIQAIAEALATTTHYQILRPWAHRYHGLADRTPWARLDVRSPEQRRAEADALKAFADGVRQADEVLAKRGLRVDLRAALDDYGLSIPTERLRIAPVDDGRGSAAELEAAAETEAARHQSAAAWGNARPTWLAARPPAPALPPKAVVTVRADA